MNTPHRLVPGSEDHTGRQWCDLCGLPQDNRIHDTSQAETGDAAHAAHQDD